mgnify:FL=1
MKINDWDYTIFAGECLAKRKTTFSDPAPSFRTPVKRMSKEANWERIDINIITIFHIFAEST